ncbi:MAG: MmgE/PrpD family protein [Candidatus Velthaea sp.]
MTATSATRAGEATALFAEHVAGMDIAGLGHGTIEHAKQALLDTIGIVVRARFDAESSGPMLEAVNALDAGGPAHAFGAARGYQPQYAALLNAAFAHTLDFDDTHVGGSIHPGAPTIPAVFAVAEAEKRSGADLLAAIVAAYDVAVRLSEALTVKAQYERGFHPTSTCGTLAAAAAVCRVLGADSGRVQNAMGIALSQAAGTMQFVRDGKWNKRFQIGFAAHNGIVAERLARAGVLGAVEAVEGEFGFAHAYGRDASFAGLGDILARPAIDETAFKPYPSCRYTHAALDEIIALRQELALEPDAIERVVIGVPRVGMPLVKDPENEKRHPANVIDGQFSMFFTGAVALTRGRMGWGDYSLLGDAGIQSLIERMEIVEDPEIEALGQSMAARVTVVANGQRHERFARAPKGEPDRPLSWDDVVAKFDELASIAYNAERRRAIVDAVRAIDQAPHVGTLAALLGAA